MSKPVYICGVDSYRGLIHQTRIMIILIVREFASYRGLIHQAIVWLFLM